MTRIRHLTGQALWVLSIVALALVAANAVAAVLDLEAVDPPGPGLAYVAATLALSVASSALLGADA